MALLIVSLCPKGKTNTFLRSKATLGRKTSILSIFVCYSQWIFGDRIPKVFLQNILMDILYDLINGVSWFGR